MTRPARARTVAAALLALLLAGCSQMLPGVGEPGGPATPAASRTTDLAAARKAAGIADCPPGSDATPVAGGLPDLDARLPRRWRERSPCRPAGTAGCEPLGAVV